MIKAGNIRRTKSRFDKISRQGEIMLTTRIRYKALPNQCTDNACETGKELALDYLRRSAEYLGYKKLGFKEINYNYDMKNFSYGDKDVLDRKGKPNGEDVVKKAIIMVEVTLSTEPKQKYNSIDLDW